MIDFNEQQESGEEPKGEQSKGEQDRSSCGSKAGPSRSWESCHCDDEGAGSTNSSDLLRSLGSQPPSAESNAPPASEVTPAERDDMWQDLVHSQQSAPEDASSSDRGDLTEGVAKTPMQWTLVDLSTSGCDKPGCDPVTCDSAECDTTDAYDGPEYEPVRHDLPEYATSGRAPAVTFDADNSPEYGYKDEPAPAPVAFESFEPETPRAETLTAKKTTAAGKRDKKAAEPKKAKAKKGAKKVAGKKATAKKAAKKGPAKKGAKKPAAAKSKKAGAKTSAPQPETDPNFPRVQAA